MDSVGIGGVEITPIYGVKGSEASYIDFLSPKWMEMLRYTVDKSRQLGMGVDMNVGTGCPVDLRLLLELAAGRLLIGTYTVDGGQQAAMKIAPPENDSTVQQYGATLKALTAYGSNGEVLNLVDKVSSDGQLNWTAPPGQWILYAGFAGKTGQVVKRAAPGGEGLVMDHLNRQLFMHTLTVLMNHLAASLLVSAPFLMIVMRFTLQILHLVSLKSSGRGEAMMSVII